MKEKISVLWFKRDLRLKDNLALNKAIEKGLRIIAIYIFEPSQEYNYDFSYKHWAFVNQSVDFLNTKIVINKYYGEAVETFNSIKEKYDIKFVFSHQETGNHLSYKRDIEIKQFFKLNDISWSEFQSNGVIRALRDKSLWDKLWVNNMTSPVVTSDLTKAQFISTTDHTHFPKEIEELLTQNLEITPNEKNAHMMLESFINEKVENYFSNISLPEKSRYHSSKLSAYISWGNISIRQIYQFCKESRSSVENKKSLDQFIARLKWHCHFIQKLESQPSLEFNNLNTSYDNIRTKKNKKFIKAWKSGSTGYPLIDAAMRCVSRTGYLNFRLRATVVSFLTHHLWQDWRHGSGHLAKMFIDYEPGIHFSQFQMQAGTVGVHTIRVYNPVKQSLEKDKDAVFISKWIPELRKIPTELRHRPWEVTEMESAVYEFKIGVDYPKPIVDYLKTAEHAKNVLHEIRKSKNSKTNSLKVMKRHVKREKSWRR